MSKTRLRPKLRQIKIGISALTKLGLLVLNRAKKETRDWLNHMRGRYYFRVKTPLTSFTQTTLLSDCSIFSYDIVIHQNYIIVLYSHKESPEIC